MSCNDIFFVLRGGERLLQFNDRVEVRPQLPCAVDANFEEVNAHNDEDAGDDAHSF